MLKKVKYCIIILILLGSTLYTLFNPNIIFKDIIEAIDIFKNNLFPAMFFFYTIADLLINYGFVELLERFFNKLFMKVFHISSASSFIVIMSMLSGFPSGSKYITSFLEKKIISKDLANYLLMFTHFSNPLFILGTISIIYGKSFAIIVFIIHYISNFILAFIIRPKEMERTTLNTQVDRKNFSDTLAQSFYNSFKILLLVLGNTIFFFTFSDIITSFINNDLIKCIVYGFLDLTKGTLFVNSINISLFYKMLLIISFLTFGGISVHFQVKEIIRKDGISYLYFLIGRIISLAISIILLVGYSIFMI